MTEINYFFKNKLIKYLTSISKTYETSKFFTKTKSKTAFDPVTKFDLKIEKKIKSIIFKKYPFSNFIGEETSPKRTKKNVKNKFTWIVDPIDGTKNFIIGAPSWGNLIGLIINDIPKYGLAYFPSLRKYYYSNGKNSFLFNNLKKKIKLKSSKTTNLNKSTIVTNTINTLKNKKLFNFFSKHKYLFKISSIDALNYCLLAEGKIDVIIESNLKNVDIFPLIPIITYSGGTISNWKGGKDLSKGDILVCSNSTLHAKMVVKLKSLLKSKI